MSSDLLAFLSARLGEDQAAARGAAVLWGDGNWTEVEADPYVHAQRHDPARVLREVTAKQAILGRHCPGGEPADYDDGCAPCMEDERIWPCLTVRALAAVYSDHPDYQQEWKP